MKAIVKVNTHEVKYVFSEDTPVTLRAADTVIGPGEGSILILDLDSSNSKVIIVEDVPEDFISDKYLYKEDTGWELNPTFTGTSVDTD